MRCPLHLAFLLCLTAGLWSCVPWTVRPIEKGERSKDSPPASLTPAAFVDSIWSGRLIPAILNSAVDARELLNALAASPEAAKERYGRRETNGPYYFIVNGQGVITAVDTRSRVGIALVDIAPFDQRPDVSIQIGPVLRGTSLRDATGIVRFSDFVNQLQFADAGNELNNRVIKEVLTPLDPSLMKGRTVSFAGTLAFQEESTPPLADLVPVVMTVGDRI